MQQDMITEPPASGASMANIVYIVYLVGVVVPFASIVGVIMAYVNKSDAAPWVQSHYSFQIRTFWIGLLISVIGWVSTFILVGWVVLLAYLVWLILRCVKGMKFLGNSQPHPDPGTWLV